MEEQIYIPSSNNAQLVIQSLNDYLKRELALPGIWSADIFYRDLRDYPVRSKKELAQAVYDACQKNITYLQFFQITRGKERVCNEFQKQLWEIFSSGSIMLYFESLFLELLEIKELNNDVITLVLYLNALSKQPIYKWNNILKGIGACCYQFFIKEPKMYTKLPYRKKIEQAEDMTDQELLNKLDLVLYPIAYHGKISINDCRTNLIEIYKNRSSN